jgi:hypothetical protein
MNLPTTKCRLAVLAAALPLLLAGCSYHYGAHAVPTGYGYQNEDYKVPPSATPVFKRRLFIEKCGHSGPCSQPVTASGSDMMVSPVAAAPAVPTEAGAWNAAASDLVNRLVAGSGQPSEAVFVRRPAPGSASEGDFANALRQALVNRGMTLAAAPGESPFQLDYTVAAPLGGSARQMLTVKLADHGKPVNEASGLYKVDADASPGMPVALPPSRPAAAAPSPFDAGPGPSGPPPLLAPQAPDYSAMPPATGGPAATEPPSLLAPSGPVLTGIND